MSQRHRKNANPPIHAQHAKVIVDLVPTLNCQNSSDLLLPNYPLDVARACRQFDLIWILIEDPLHCIPQIEGPSYCLGSWIVGWHPQREERHMYAAFLQSRQINHPIWQPRADVDFLDQHSLRCIVVCVETKHTRLDPP